MQRNWCINKGKLINIVVNNSIRNREMFCCNKIILISLDIRDWNKVE